VGSERKRRAIPALVAVLILALLAAGTRATAGAAGDGTAAPDISGTGQTGGKNAMPDNEDLPAARPHPRGLPRGRARGRARPRGRPQEESREPGPLVSETVGRQGPPGVGLITVIGAGLRSLVHSRSRKTTVEDSGGSEWARGPGQGIGASRRFPLDAGITRGLTNRRIAEELFLSERTVHRHVSNVLKKLGIASREQVAARLGDHQPLSTG
jgi:Bacterial regulatory proteins, luxR family